jgi:hypothetical protein
VQGCTLRLPQAGAAYRRIDVRPFALLRGASRALDRPDVLTRAPSRAWLTMRVPSSSAHVRECDTTRRRARGRGFMMHRAIMEPHMPAA